MSLGVGTRVGPYEIVAPLGAGGMGEVYRARDTKLNRDVAIKVLLPAVANDPDRLARFSREAQVLASLNHPNIAHIYGLEEADGVTRARHGAGRRRGPRAADRARTDSARRGAADRAADRRGARSRARARHHSSRSEARQHQGPRRRHGEGARLRPREGRRTRAGLRRRAPRPR